jgi:hypothetical protein
MLHLIQKIMRNWDDMKMERQCNMGFCKEELPEQWQESIIIPIYKKGDKTDCSNY